MAKRRRKKTRKAGKHRWWRAAAVSAVLLAAAAAWLIWPFWQLSGQFGSDPTKQPSRLYGRSTVLRVGATGSVEGLLRELEAAGYAATDDRAALVPGTFLRAGAEVEIFRRRFPSIHGIDGGDRLRVRFAGGSIDAISGDDGRGSGGELTSALLDPPLIASYYGPDLRERRPVSLDELPEDLILAVLAAEDASFLKHPGLSFKGILRAAWANVAAGEVQQGGSTLTQQLVKNLYLTHERRWTRKLQEAVLAVMLELRYDKRAILQAYLNEIFWGRSGSINLMGVGAAAWAHFGKHPSQLTLAESALLAGMIQSPASLSPRTHREAARQRRDAILARLAQLQWVKTVRLEQAAQAPVVARPGPLVVRRVPYFAGAAAAEAARRFGLEELRDAGYVLHATLSASDQKRAEEAVRWGVEALEKGWEKDRKTQAPLQSALISIDPRDGGVLAYVGGRDFATSQFDRVSQARRQAGSAFKPIVFSAAFEQRVATPASFLEDAPYTVRLAGREWNPQNSDGSYRGWVSARTALEKSLNVPTARLAMAVGIERVVDMAQRLGVSRRLDPYPAIALGAMEVTPLELATVYSTFAGGGMRPTVHGLVAVFDREGRRLPAPPLPPPERVLEEDVAFLVTQVLQGVLERGTGTGARQQGLQDALAGKTGTTNSRRDSWFAGYSPERTTLVWVGYDDNSKTRLSGSRAALPIWTRFTHKVRPRGGYSAFRKPEGVVAAWIDPETGGLATDRCYEVRLEHFLADFTPRALCPEHGGRRARPLEQPDGLEPERQKRHPFKRWLEMLRGKKKKQREAI